MAFDFSVENNPLFKEAQRLAIPPFNTLADIGCGLRPQTSIVAKQHTYVEPHCEYADIIQEKGHDVVRKTALDFLSNCQDFDIITMFDVIEHMEKDEGKEVVNLVKEKARQVFIFTPNGFMSQEETGDTDAWGFHGQKWQRHRSGWIPEDFPGWKVLTSPVCGSSFEGGTLLAVWTNE